MNKQRVHRCPRLIAGVLAVLVTGISCSQAKPGSAGASGPEKPVIVASILPQVYFVNRIAGNSVSVVTLVGEGQNPHSYEPSPAQMAQISSARLWFTMGLEFEKPVMPKIKSLYPSLKIVDGSAGAVKRPMDTHHHDGDHRDDPHEGHHEETDPHIWLGSQGAKAMAAVITAELSTLLPAQAAELKKNEAALVAEIDSLYGKLRTALAAQQGKTVFVYHPSFGYLLDDLGLKQEAVETGGKEPGAKTLSVLIEQAKKDAVKVIFVQKQFPATAAKTVASAINGQVELIDDLSPDWANNITHIGEVLIAGLK